MLWVTYLSNFIKNEIPKKGKFTSFLNVLTQREPWVEQASRS
jgi:hypothetical protein